MKTLGSNPPQHHSSMVTSVGGRSQFENFEFKAGSTMDHTFWSNTNASLSGPADEIFCNMAHHFPMSRQVYPIYSCCGAFAVASQDLIIILITLYMCASILTMSGPKIQWSGITSDHFIDIHDRIIKFQEHLIEHYESAGLPESARGSKAQQTQPTPPGLINPFNQ